MIGVGLPFSAMAHYLRRVSNTDIVLCDVDSTLIQGCPVKEIQPISAPSRSNAHARGLSLIDAIIIIGNEKVVRAC